MSADPNKKSPRTFQCRDMLWDNFEQMARELECSVDYLINDAMKQYARQRSLGGGNSSIGAAPNSLGRGDPPTVAGAAAAPNAGVNYARPTLGSPSFPPPQRPSAAAPGMAPGMTGRAPAPPPPGGGMGGLRPPPQGGGARGLPVPQTSPNAMRTGALPVPPPPRGGARESGPPAAHATPPGYAAAQQHGGPRQHQTPPPRDVQGGMNGGGYRPSTSPQGAALSVTYNGERFSVNKERFVIGRGKQSSDLTLKDPNVSRQHAMVEYQNGVYYMVDMGSTNGVEYNGQRIARKQIAEGDTFRICDHEIRFSFR